MPVPRVSTALRTIPETSGSGRKVHLGAAGDCPISPLVSRLRERKIGHGLSESKRFIVSWGLSEGLRRLPIARGRV